MLNLNEQPNLESLKSFYEVAKTGTLAETERRTGVPRSTLSRHIASLEKELSAVLFYRSDRGLTLTQVGRIAFQHSENIFKAAVDLYEAVLLQNVQISGPIKIIASSGIASIILPKIISRIHEVSDDIQLEVISTNSVEKEAFQDADIAIQTYAPIQLDLIALKVGQINYGAYASINYLERVGTPNKILELKDHCIVGSMPKTLENLITNRWGKDILDHVDVIKCKDYPLIWELVAAGCGIGLTHLNHGDANPAVKRIMANHGSLTLPVWMVAHPDVNTRARIRLVFDFMVEEMKLALRY